MKKKIKDILSILLICGLILSFHAFVLQTTIVVGSSMENTLSDGDILFTERLTKTTHKPYKRFQVVIFESGDKYEPLYIKRIIGLPGETIQLKDGQIYINGEVLHESYGKEIYKKAGLAEQEITLGDDEYFVLGDNRNDSRDSRVFGPVHKSVICGRVVLRLFPFTIFKTE